MTEYDLAFAAGLDRGLLFAIAGLILGGIAGFIVGVSRSEARMWR